MYISTDLTKNKEVITFADVHYYKLFFICKIRLHLNLNTWLLGPITKKKEEFDLLRT